MSQEQPFTDERQLTAEDVVNASLPIELAVSPDGRWVAYQVSLVGKRAGAPMTSLWLASTDGGSPARMLADDSDWNAMPRWAPDSALLYVLSDRKERGVPRPYRMRPDDGGVTELPAPWGAMSGYLPLTDGRTLAVLAADEPTEEDERRWAEGDDAIVWGERVPCHRLRLLDVDTGGCQVMTGLGERHVVAVAQRPDGGPLAVLSWSHPDIDPGNREAALHVVEPATGTVTELGAVGHDARTPAWWRDDDGWHVAYVSRPLGELVGGDAVFDVAVPQAGPAAGHRDLTAGTAGCPTGLAQVADGPPLALFADRLDTVVRRLEPAVGRFRRLSTLKGEAGLLSAGGAGGVIAVRMATAYASHEVYAGTPEGRLRPLSDISPGLRGIRWGVRERLAYQAADGLELDGLLVLPPGRNRADGPFPLVTLVHGGPYGRHADQLALGPADPGQLLAAAGYAIFLPNPRGSIGRGREFAAMVAGRVGEEEWDDILAGIDLLVAEGVADPDRLGIGGWSHGGFMAAWAAGRSDRFKAAVMGAGISDWAMLAGTGEWGAEDGALAGSYGWEGPGPLPHRRHSPISYASQVRTPVLIVHGERDTNVPLGQATYFHRALRQHGAPHTFVVYPREGHGLRERGHQLDFMRRTREWFDRWLNHVS
jgi:dipeptidyl aminopeptidase/acylaminoacyl peptidase